MTTIHDKQLISNTSPIRRRFTVATGHGLLTFRVDYIAKKKLNEYELTVQFHLQKLEQDCFDHKFFVVDRITLTRFFKDPEFLKEHLQSIILTSFHYSPLQSRSQSPTTPPPPRDFDSNYFL